MEVVERFNKRNILYLNSLDLTTMSKYFYPFMTNEDKQKSYIRIKNWCQSHIKTNFQIKQYYKYSENSKSKSGRLFGGGSIQGVAKHFRGLVCRDLTTDIDIKCCHPILLRYLCKQHNIYCSNLEYYINNREQLYNLIGEDRDYAKKVYLSAVNNDKINRKIKCKQFKLFDKEMKQIQKQLLSLDEYQHFLNEVPESKDYNKTGSAINRLLCVWENNILQIILSVLNNKNIEVAALMYDGVMIYGDYYNDKELLTEIETEINNKYKGIDLNVVYKEHSNLIQVPHSFDEKTTIFDEHRQNPHSYENMKIEFEKTHAKIINKSNYIYYDEDKNEFNFMSKKDLNDAYEHIQCFILKYDKNNGSYIEDKQGFIKKWVLDENIRCYNNVDVYPPPHKCPDHIFNLWTGFAMDKIENYDHNQEAVDIFLKHIKIICNNEEEVYDYIIKWLAQMVQFPGIKTPCPIFISEKGAGKGTINDLLTAMFGFEKVLMTPTPSRDCFGQFNGLMCNKFLVNLNEMNKKELEYSLDKFKSYLTDPVITINNKNIKQIQMKSFHRFWISTNNDEPIPVDRGNRRFVIVRSSDELIGNTQYFNKIHKLITDIDAIKSFYEYLKSIEGVEDFNSIKRPETEYQKDLIEMSIQPMEVWAEHYVKEHIEHGYFETLLSVLYDNFCEFNKIHYPNLKMNNVAFGIRLKRLNIPGFTRERRGGSTFFIIDIEEAVKYFKIDKSVCKLEVQEDDLEY